MTLSGERGCANLNSRGGTTVFKCAIVWAYICTFVTMINIYFTLRKVNIFLILWMSSISLSWFQCNQTTLENDPHPYLWVIIEETDIYRSGKFSCIFVYNASFFFAHLIEKPNRINRTVKQSLHNIRLNDFWTPIVLSRLWPRYMVAPSMEYKVWHIPIIHTFRMKRFYNWPFDNYSETPI